MLNVLFQPINEFFPHQSFLVIIQMSQVYTYLVHLSSFFLISGLYSYLFSKDLWLSGAFSATPVEAVIESESISGLVSGVPANQITLIHYLHPFRHSTIIILLFLFSHPVALTLSFQIQPICLFNSKTLRSSRGNRSPCTAVSSDEAF